MKISYRNYPILQKLENGSLGVLPFYDLDKLFISKHITDFTNTWKKNHNHFKKEINLITKPFNDAIQKSKDKLTDLLHDIIANELGDLLVSGTYIIDGNVYMIYWDTKKGLEHYECSVFTFTNYGMPLFYYRHSNIHDSFFGWVSNAINIKKDKETLEKFFFQIIKDILICALFKTFTQTDIKIIEPKQKIKDISCKYVNNTNFKILKLDSTWYTTLVKSDSFKVNGHLRWQPKKVDGQWTKELIWIKDFTKSGYTRKAAKLVSK